MAAAITDLLTQATTSSRPVPTQVTTLRVGGGTTLACNALTGWPTGTAVHFCTYKIDTSGNKIAGSQIDMKGVVSGTNITNVTIKAGTDVGNAVGDIVEAAPTAAWANDVVTWGTAHANQDGSLLTSAVQTALSLGTGALNGWNALGFAPATVTALGNRSYSLLFSGQDLTSTLSAGYRLRTTRTVAAPTQCTSLNGTTQFYSKTSPAGMTFTDDFTVSAWIKLNSYAVGSIASRINGTQGWDFQINASGQVVIAGFNASLANYSLATSYQSVPLNRWVHIAAQLDMSSFTATTTTSYVMIDGVDVPASVTRAGTNPTALVQAGNLEIGSKNGGSQFFPGKIAQVAIYNAKVTQATILASMHQGLAGTETSLISAYSFNNSINDLNANANNLTPNGSAVATSADSPFGGQAGGTISSTLDYGIVQSVAFSTNTTVTVQVPEGCTIPTSGGVSSVVYSSNKAPYGMPVQTAKWRVISLYQARATKTSPTSAVAYNTGEAITFPLGEGVAGYEASPYCNSSASVQNNIRCDLNPTIATYSATSDFVASGSYASTANDISSRISVRVPISLTVQTVYYLNIYAQSAGTLLSSAWLHDFGKGTIYWEPALL